MAAAVVGNLQHVRLQLLRLSPLLQLIVQATFRQLILIACEEHLEVAITELEGDAIAVYRLSPAPKASRNCWRPEQLEINVERRRGRMGPLHCIDECRAGEDALETLHADWLRFLDQCLCQAPVLSLKLSSAQRFLQFRTIIHDEGSPEAPT